MDNEDSDLLKSAGWVFTTPWNGVVCRMCHNYIYGGMAWASPNYSFYHTSCVWLSPSAKRDIRNARKSQEVNDGEE